MQTESRLVSKQPPYIPPYCLSLEIFRDYSIRLRCSNLDPYSVLAICVLEPLLFVNLFCLLQNRSRPGKQIQKDQTNPRICRRSGLAIAVDSCRCSPPFAGSPSCFLACFRASRKGPSNCSPDRECRSRRSMFSAELARHRRTCKHTQLGRV